MPSPSIAAICPGAIEAMRGASFAPNIFTSVPRSMVRPPGFGSSERMSRHTVLAGALQSIHVDARSIFGAYVAWRSS